MSTKNLEVKIKSIVAQALLVEESVIQIEKNLVEDLGMDSFDKLMLCQGLEDEFSFDVNDDELSQLKTVGDVVNFIENQLNKQTA